LVTAHRRDHDDRVAIVVCREVGVGRRIHLAVDEALVAEAHRSVDARYCAGRCHRRRRNGCAAPGGDDPPLARLRGCADPPRRRIRSRRVVLDERHAPVQRDDARKELVTA
jgi:hypothetical protein